MEALVGCTGFVGSNLLASHAFDCTYHSTDIQDAYGTRPDLLVYAGIRAEKYMANMQPELDRLHTNQAVEIIERIQPRKLVLISTIDVFPTPIDVDERSAVDRDGLQAYGRNRYDLECQIRERYEDALIVRLPGLFGPGIKKNFIYDMIRIIPSAIKQDKMAELLERDASLEQYYTLDASGFYRCRDLNNGEIKTLKEKFFALGFTALNFTDSRSQFQFYPLVRLWEDIQVALDNDLRLWHAATEPVSAADIYYDVTGETYANELGRKPALYRYRTIYDAIFGGADGYICSRQEIMADIKKFVEKELSTI